MKCLKHDCVSASASERNLRDGVTLTEVLVSVLVMSIGVISVAALFPIAVLRSAQATTLTSATILKQNTESVIDVFPELVHDPDGDSQPDSLADNGGIQEHFSSNYIVDPLGLFLAYKDGRNPEIDEKRYVGFTRIRSGKSNQWRRVVPPGRGGQGSWKGKGKGNDDDTEVADPDEAEQFLWDLCSLPDNWTEVKAGVVDGDSISVTEATEQGVRVLRFRFRDLSGVLDGYRVGDLQLFGAVEVNEDINANGNLDPGEDTNGNGQLESPFSFTCRVIDVDKDGTVTALSPQTEFSLDETPISSVQLNVRDRKYTWFLTVRKNAEGEANGNIAVFFKRSFSAADEEIHRAYDSGEAIPARPGATTLRFAPKDDDASRIAPWQPLVQTGSYILDVDNMHWYRVESVTSEGSTDPELGGKPFLEVTLDEPIRQRFSNAMLMRGIISVFPMHTRGL